MLPALRNAMKEGMLDTRCSILDARCWILDAGKLEYWIGVETSIFPFILRSLSEGGSFHLSIFPSFHLSIIPLIH
jgi:hypothetical protein